MGGVLTHVKLVAGWEVWASRWRMKTGSQASPHSNKVVLAGKFRNAVEIRLQFFDRLKIRANKF